MISIGDRQGGDRGPAAGNLAAAAVHRRLMPVLARSCWRRPSPPRPLQPPTPPVRACRRIPRWPGPRGRPPLDVCHAHPPRAECEVFGVYLGHHPSARPKAADRAEMGLVDGHLCVGIAARIERIRSTARRCSPSARPATACMSGCTPTTRRSCAHCLAIIRRLRCPRRTTRSSPVGPQSLSASRRTAPAPWQPAEQQPLRPHACASTSTAGRVVVFAISRRGTRTGLRSVVHGATGLAEGIVASQRACPRRLGAASTRRICSPARARTASTTSRRLPRRAGR